MADDTHSASLIRQLVERASRLEDEKAGINVDIRDVYAEGKSQGLDPKQLRRCVREYRKDAAKRREEQAVFETYAAQLDLF